jgi:hypothetical protein
MSNLLRIRGALVWMFVVSARQIRVNSVNMRVLRNRPNHAARPTQSSKYTQLCQADTPKPRKPPATSGRAPATSHTRCVNNFQGRGLVNRPTMTTAVTAVVHTDQGIRQCEPGPRDQSESWHKHSNVPRQAQTSNMIPWRRTWLQGSWQARSTRSSDQFQSIGRHRGSRPATCSKHDSAEEILCR